jgi:hypothetical protein
MRLWLMYIVGLRSYWPATHWPPSLWCQSGCLCRDASRGTVDCITVEHLWSGKYQLHACLSETPHHNPGTWHGSSAGSIWLADYHAWAVANQVRLQCQQLRKSELLIYMKQKLVQSHHPCCSCRIQHTTAALTSAPHHDFSN